MQRRPHPHLLCPVLIPILRVIHILWDLFIQAYGLEDLVAEKVQTTHFWLDLIMLYEASVET